MAQRKTLRAVKAEKAALKRKEINRKRIIVLVVEILVFIILLGIGYVMTEPDALNQIEWLQNILQLKA